MEDRALNARESRTSGISPILTILTWYMAHMADLRSIKLNRMLRQGKVEYMSTKYLVVKQDLRHFPALLMLVDP